VGRKDDSSSLQYLIVIERVLGWIHGSNGPYRLVSKEHNWSSERIPRIANHRMWLKVVAISRSANHRGPNAGRQQSFQAFGAFHSLQWPHEARTRMQIRRDEVAEGSLIKWPVGLNWMHVPSQIQQLHIVDVIVWCCRTIAVPMICCMWCPSQTSCLWCGFHCQGAQVEHLSLSLSRFKLITHPPAHNLFCWYGSLGFCTLLLSSRRRLSWRVNCREQRAVSIAPSSSMEIWRGSGELFYWVISAFLNGRRKLGISPVLMSPASRSGLDVHV
jgi:hypothetical protein